MSLSNPIAALRRHVSRRPLLAGAAALALLAAGCASDAVVAPPPLVNDAHMYWALTLDHHGITMSTVAPYDTIRLTATPRTLDGTSIDSLPAPTFTSLDLERAQVSADGLVRVIKSGNRIPVVATLVVGNLRHSDTAFINVTTLATPPVLDTFSIHPIPPDSAKTAASKLIVPRATTADGTPITGLSVYYTVSDFTTAMIDRALGRLSRVRAGQVTVIASATVYGVTKADTVTYRIGNPLTGILNVAAEKDASGRSVNGFKPDLLLIGPGGTVDIVNLTGVATDLTFDDPTNIVPDSTFCVPPYTTLNPAICAGGNVEAFARDSSDQSGLTALRVRRFPLPGTYHYHSTIFGTTGTIVVSDDTLPTT
ncbi:MAG TPA: hypothetical protein VFS44_09135 [Gemmatimonadaceae bacterium]|nr:hypothetical protein [Gemmatimonadaceae bacterium]